MTSNLAEHVRMARLQIAAAALALLATGGPALAGTHAVVIDPLRPTNDIASLDVSAEPAQVVTYTIFPDVNGGAGAPVTLTAEPNFGNVTTNPQDLFEASGGRLALVLATTANAGVASTAVLRQGKLLVSVPDERAAGRFFQFPLGELSSNAGAILYVAAPGTPASVSVRYVSSSGQLIDGFSLLPSSIRAIPLDRSMTNVSVFATSPVICQVTIQGHGREADSYIVLPAP